MGTIKVSTYSNTHCKEQKHNCGKDNSAFLFQNSTRQKSVGKLEVWHVL